MAARRSVRYAASRAFKFEGLPELQNQLGNLVNEVTGKEMKNVYVKAAVELAAEARKNAPVLTGKLKSAIFASRGEESKPSAIVGVNYRVAGYAHNVEFGHAGPRPAPPRPFMRPAVDAKRETIRKILSDGLTDIVKKYS